MGVRITSNVVSKAAITLIAIGLLLFRIFDKNAFDRIDTIGFGLLAVAVLPWAATFISEIKVGGVFETKLRDLSNKVTEAHNLATNATQRAMTAEDLAVKPTNPTPEATSANGLEALAQKYVQLRGEMPSGDERTSRMSSIFKEMTSVAWSLGDKSPAANWFDERDPGKRLAAIAHSYVFQEPSSIPNLIRAVQEMRQPFVQYWALRVILDTLKAKGILGLSPTDRRHLVELQDELPRETDRGFLIRSINDLISRLPSVAP